MRLKTLVYLTVTCSFIFFLTSLRGDDVISGKLEFLIGEYTYLCTYDNGKRKDNAELPDKYTLRITKKSQLIVSKNGRKTNKYRFSNVQLPIQYDYEYVIFYKGNQNYPLFYKGDTVVMLVEPYEFMDNYFVKIHK